MTDKLAKTDVDPTTGRLVKRKPNELRDLIEGPDFRAQLIKALPKSLTPERFVRITATSMLRNPRLMQCTRETFFRCILDLAAMGLEPDGRQAHLIPRRNKTGGVDCTLVVDYKGLKELLYRNGDIIDEHSDVVGDMDFFEYEFGSQKHLTHKPNIHSRGRIFCAYSYVTLPKGGTAFEVMSTEEIDMIRKRSPAGNDGPWVTDWSEMAKKTVFKRLSKSLPLSPKTRDAIELDQTYDTITPEPISRAVIGGRNRDILPDEADEQTSEVQEPDPVAEPEPPVPQETRQTPPEPVSAPPDSDKPPGPLTLIRARLKAAGFKSDELLSLLKSVRLINPDIKDFSMVPRRALDEVLNDWDSCVERLRQERDKTKPAAEPTQEDLPV